MVLEMGTGMGTTATTMGTMGTMGTTEKMGEMGVDDALPSITGLKSVLWSWRMFRMTGVGGRDF